ncbi:T9SS type A sorting domain-containing protein [Aurantibacillus circumpalustris]|uniref:T9SS type A sorting domain-containing protein n=1 Tax=Aurantibacillus circumpalustris TaxID=3036359 RepID=UPI00295BAC7F|nr:T9SS type A sorting domain-containing protein [Aurantibacillus circumpalustris]
MLAPNPQNLSNPTYSLNPGGFSNSNGAFAVTPNSTLSYSLYTSGQNTASVMETTSVVITVSVLSQPQAVPSVTQSNCTSTLSIVKLNLSFTPASPLPAYTISWTPIPANVSFPQQTSVTAVSPGPYNAIITAAGGCSASVNFTITPQPEPAFFTINAPSLGIVLNCFNPTLPITAAPSTNSYTWTSSTSAPLTGSIINVSSQNIGIWTVNMGNASGCTASQTFAISQNTSTPTSTLSTNLMNITCSQTITPTLSVVVTPSLNVSHYFYAPTTGIFIANSYTAIYAPGGTGTFTHCAIDNSSGCSTCKTFTVASTSSLPTYSLSSPQSFTLGCGTKSVAMINIINGATNPVGGQISYTLLAPGSSTVIAPGNLSGVNTYTAVFPGTWTAIVKDNTSGCITKTNISIISNTNPPDISVVVPSQILNCNTTSVTLKATSDSPNATYSWVPGFVASNSININAYPSSITQSLINNYTVTVTDIYNNCKSYSVIPMYQNIYPPKAKINTNGTLAINCVSPTVVLYNNSSTGIPLNTPFTTNSLIVGYLWEGPSPQIPLQVSSTYTAGTPGVYTLTAKDLNNGCTSQTVTTITDNRFYPDVSSTPGAFLLPCPGIVTIFPTVNGPLTGVTYSWTSPANATTSASNGPNLTTNTPGIYTIAVTNVTSGCVSTVTIAVYACVGIDKNNEKNKNIRIFPNPNNGEFTIITEDVQNNSFIEIYNSIGTLVHKQAIHANKTLLNRRELSSGIYVICVVENNTVIYTSKYVKE